MNHFFQRGGAWVLVQGLLLGAVAVLAVISRSGPRRPLIVGTGVLLVLVGAVVGLAGAAALGRNLTPFPKPGDHATLTRHGIYAVIRHPLYTSVMAAALGWSLVWQSWPALLVACALIPFFHAKARREERWLRGKFPEYGDYQQRVRRFLPWP